MALDKIDSGGTVLGSYPYTSESEETTFRNSYIKKYYDSSENEPNWVWHVSNYGLVVIRDWLCHIWWYRSKRSRLGIFNVARDMKALGGDISLSTDYSSPPLCKC